MAESRGLRHGYVTNVRDVAESIRRAVDIAEEKAGVKVKKAFVGIGGIGLSAACVVSSDHDLARRRGDHRARSSTSCASNARRISRTPPSPTAGIIYDIPLQHKIDGTPVLGEPEGMNGNKIELKTLFITCLDHHVADIIRP